MKNEHLKAILDAIGESLASKENDLMLLKWENERLKKRVEELESIIGNAEDSASPAPEGDDF